MNDILDVTPIVVNVVTVLSWYVFDDTLDPRTQTLTLTEGVEVHGCKVIFIRDETVAPMKKLYLQSRVRHFRVSVVQRRSSTSGAASSESLMACREEHMSALVTYTITGEGERGNTKK